VVPDVRSRLLLGNGYWHSNESNRPEFHPSGADSEYVDLYKVVWCIHNVSMIYTEDAE